MAALNLPRTATYVVHENVTVNTTDREDHTFCGIIFPLQCKSLIPVEYIVINSISVRGMLGPMTVWVSNSDNDMDHNNHDDNNHHSEHTNNSSSQQNHQKITLDSNQWTMIYSQTLSPSPYTYKKLDLSDAPSIYLRPGQVRGIYIHSSLPSDQAIVYDNYTRHSSDRSSDSVISILPGMAHVSTEPFGHLPIWGWGDAWRRGRKFVGKVEYGVVYKLWNPYEHSTFGNKFQYLAMTLFACQRRWESPFSRLPDECIFYILNMCKWDWVGDDSKGMLQSYKVRKRRERELQKEQQSQSGIGELVSNKNTSTANSSVNSIVSLHVEDEGNVLYEETADDDLDIDGDAYAFNAKEMIMHVCTCMVMLLLFTGVGFIFRKTESSKL